MTAIDGLLIDLDGTVWEGDSIVPGAVEAVDDVRERGLPHAFTTNTSRMSRRDVVERLAGLGLDVEPGQVLTAPWAAAHWLRSHGLTSVRLLLPEATQEDFSGFELAPPGETVEAVVVGDLGAGFTFERLNAAFRALRSGARLVAVHKNRYWLPEEGPTLDAGPFVVGLEYAAGVEAVLVGKPARTFFELAAGILERPVDRLAVVGDDPESDIRGARSAGLTAVQVETGKFDPGDAAEAPEVERPHHRIRSIAGLPDLLDELSD